MAGWFTVGTLLSAGGVFAGDDAEAPADVQIRILLKALEHDKNLPIRAPDQVVIGVIFAAGEESEKASRAVLGFLEEAIKANVQAGGRPLKALKHVFSDAGGLADFIEAEKADFVYIPPGLDASLDALLKVCRDKDVGSLAGSSGYVQEGAAIGIKVQGAKPQMVINLPASQEEGTAFDARLLQLAKVIR